MRKPFFKKSHRAWYVHHNGTLTKLGKTEEEANKAWAALLTDAQPAAPTVTGLTLGELVERWLAWVGRHKSPETLRSYRNYAKRWAELKNKLIFGNLPAATIRGYHVTEFCDLAYAETDGYSDSVRWQAQKVAVVMFSWAKAEGLIDVNPLLGYRKSARCGKRDEFITEADYLRMKPPLEST
jgi:hypothetical protein